MTFLAMIIALIVLQLRSRNNPVHDDHWFFSWQGMCRGFGFGRAVSLALYVIVPVLVVRFVLNVIDGWLFGLFWIAGSALILLYSFGREQFELLSQRYRSYCRSGDFEAAYLFAQQELELDPEQLDVSSPRAVHEVIQAQLLYLGYQRWFAVLFYFVLLGPLAALAYRLLQLSRNSPERVSSRKVLFYLDWIPTRVLAAGFAVTGNFLTSRDTLLSSFSNFEETSGAVLLSVGQAAIGAPSLDDGDGQADLSQRYAGETSELRDLMSRSAGAWLLVISLFVLFF